MKLFNSKYFILLIVLLILSAVIAFFSKDSYFVLFRRLDFLILPVASPSGIIITILLAFYFIINLMKKKQFFFKTTIDKRISGFFLYLIFYLSGILFISLIQWFYKKSAINFRVDALFSTTMQDLIWFVIFLGLFGIYMVGSLWIFSLIHKLQLSFRLRNFIVIVSMALVVIIIIVTGMSDLIIPFILSFLIFTYVLELYSEKQKLSSSWLFTFMVVISGFTSLIIFSVYNRTLNEKRLMEIKSGTYTRDVQLEKQIIKPGSTISVSKDIFFPDTNLTKQDSYVERLNSGFLAINDSVFFNPLNGDYIKQKGNVNDDNIIQWICYYNKKKTTGGTVIPEFPKNIILFEDKILFNNTAFNQIPLEVRSGENSASGEFVKSGNSYLRYKTKDGIEIINIQKIPGFLRPLSLFSLLFVITGVFIFIISVLNSKILILPEQLQISFKGFKTLKSRIQGSIIGLFVLSFISIGIIAFSYIKNLSLNYQKDAATYNATELINKIRTNTEFDSKAGLLDLLLKRQKENGEYFYMYDDRGILVEDLRRNTIIPGVFPASQTDTEKPDFSEKLSYKIENIAGKDIMITKFELKTEEDTYSICGYNTEDKLYSATASNVLSNFLNVYVLLFLMSGGIAIAVANSISNPVEKLSERLEVLNLNEKNEILQWNNNDEIGQLIAIYNKAILKLEESKKIIAKIERDSAWREMAKQVAHEIKNPLTPLKLNIQYLQGIVANYPERAADMIKQLAPGLIEQINNLDKISTEFSDFAKMPKARNEKVNLNEIVTVVHDFFRKREDLSIKLYVPINDLVVFADKNHMVSILNNIIKNAIQAIPNDREGEIIINLFKEGENAIIKITDNGTGIPEDMVEKVFSPNFTTKSSGTGLGLAISTNMIQAFNGKIYFTTVVDEGTSFFVEIPLMRIKDNYGDQKVVSLDD
ncbi:MAG: ATP-binding protein [Deltaproteobacteria bacterium]